MAHPLIKRCSALYFFMAKRSRTGNAKLTLNTGCPIIRPDNLDGYAVDILEDVCGGLKMKKQFFSTIAIAWIASIMITAGCSAQAPPAGKANPPAEGGPAVILVENTSISLPVEYFKSDRDRFMESIHSTLNSLLGGKSR